MSELKYGCQTFTWEMLGPQWKGSADDLVSAIAGAGYQGIEITDTMIGSYADRPAAFAERLDEAGLTLVAFAYGSDSGFCEPDAVTRDLETGRRWIEFLAHFPKATLSLGSATVMSDGPREDKFETAALVYNETAALGKAAGVTVAVHPSSHHNTLLFDRSDYDAIFAQLDPQVCWVPDTGHILRGGQDLSSTLRTFGDRIRYVHLKDVDGAGDWAMLGEGVCDVPAVLSQARLSPRFNGWIVVEEESDAAAKNPETAVAKNYATVSQIMRAPV